MPKQKSRKPGRIRVEKDWYSALVLQVVDRDPTTGRPRTLRALYDEESTKIEGGEEFLVVFAKTTLLRPNIRAIA